MEVHRTHLPETAYILQGKLPFELEQQPPITKQPVAVTAQTVCRTADLSCDRYVNPPSAVLWCVVLLTQVPVQGRLGVCTELCHEVQWSTECQVLEATALQGEWEKGVRACESHVRGPTHISLKHFCKAPKCLVFILQCKEERS